MAKSDVGVLTVYLDAVTAKFDTGLQRSEKRIKGFKGTIGGLGNTWTEMNSKISLAASGIEFATGALAGAAKLFKGQTGDFVEYIQGLPIIGGAARRARELRMELDGSADAAKKLANELERVKAAGRAWDKQWDTYRKALDAAEKGTIPLADRLQILNEQLTKGQDAADRLSLDISREDQIRALEDQIEQNKEVIKNAQHRKRVNDQLRKQVEYMVQIHDLEDRIRAQAEREATAKERAAETSRRMASATKAMEALESRRAALMGKGISAGASSFTTPLGTISLPSMTTAVDLSRKQLTELQQIEAELAGLREDIKRLAA